MVINMMFQIIKIILAIVGIAFGGLFIVHDPFLGMNAIELRGCKDA